MKVIPGGILISPLAVLISAGWTVDHDPSGFFLKGSHRIDTVSCIMVIPPVLSIVSK
jgi:hypothetical protein